MKDFNHANVLSLIGVVMNEQKLPMVIIPFMSKGDLKKVLKDESEVRLSPIFNQQFNLDCARSSQVHSTFPDITPGIFDLQFLCTTLLRRISVFRPRA